MNYKELYEEWLSNTCFDDETKAELKAISDDENEIKERFYQELEFGTAGLRGIIGAGVNRMNVYTVRKATQGLANYILKVGGADKGVAIAYDSRRMSPEFADVAALCLNANGIKTYRFESLRPTPELSFAVRYLNCIAGIVITASHNPAEYNGYKVYWEDGAQIVSPVDKEIMAEVKAVTDFSKIKDIGIEEAKEKVSELTEKYGQDSESEFGVREVYTDNIFEYKDMKYATTTKLSRNLDNEEKSKAEAEKAQKEAEEAKAKEEAASGSYVNGVCFSIAPVTGRISSRYGANESIRNHTHKGLDIAASNGTPIKAAADGVVTYAQYNSGGYGNLVKISHGNGVESYYGHCSKLYVKVGQTVKAGDTIAAVGSTGNSTGNHLHFEIRVNGEQVNPQNYLYN